MSPNLAEEMGLDLARSVFAFAGDAGGTGRTSRALRNAEAPRPGLLVTEKAQINPSLSLSGVGRRCNRIAITECPPG